MAKLTTQPDQAPRITSRSTEPRTMRRLSLRAIGAFPELFEGILEHLVTLHSGQLGQVNTQGSAAIKGKAVFGLVSGIWQEEF